MSLIADVRAYLQTCPALEGKRINIDNLGEEVGEFSIDSEPTETIVKQYLDGTSRRRLQFTVAGRTFFSDEIDAQKHNLDAFEALGEWLDKQKFYGRLPQLGEGKTASTLRMVTTAYPIVVEPTTGTARYQASFELIYLQEVII